MRSGWATYGTARPRLAHPPRLTAAGALDGGIRGGAVVPRPSGSEQMGAAIRRQADKVRAGRSRGAEVVVVPAELAGQIREMFNGGGGTR
jgi:hypothetical protein